MPLDCEPNELTCDADRLIQCNDEGTAGTVTDCLLRCHDTDVRCNKLDPSNGLAAHLDDAEANGPNVQLGDGATFDTTTGEVKNGDGSVVEIPHVLLPAPDSGVEVRVFKVGSITFGDTQIRQCRNGFGEQR